MEPVPFERQTQEILDQLKALALECDLLFIITSPFPNTLNRNPESPPKVLVCIGRPGVGKSSYVEDVSGLRGHPQQSLDPVTQTCELAKVRIEDKACFIIDTPGFDPAYTEEIFQEIVRGIQAILDISRIAGFLYFTCINQPRFDSFDHKVLQILRAMSGDDYIPCMTFITTFWTTDRPSQQANFATQLEDLKDKWRQAFGAHVLHFYQHGRGHNAEGEITESFIDWFDDSGRKQIAQHAREMIMRRYCGTNASETQEITPKIVEELRCGTPVHETAAGRFLGLQSAPSSTGPLPTSNEQHRGDINQQRSSASCDSNAESSCQENQSTGSRGIPRNHQGSPETPQAPETSLFQTILEGASWFFRNVQFNVNVGSSGGAERADYNMLGNAESGVSLSLRHGVKLFAEKFFNKTDERYLRCPKALSRASNLIDSAAIDKERRGNN
ncbi:uncharacterized protein N7496_010277 [Penicillium cataractarum]|uniref:G domain-containing protein n=1 Tax=Penicillium cataractarum TaxID=2100454 RepID=A0A9W9RT71_9EURO|nr:uncharacterized protein N7496_010277 [Penicillium cataractarum]KAJ5364564.1 hypothetical protein N7496_010277 [Penicillium cataractarum]